MPASRITVARQIDVSGPRFTTGWLLIVTTTVSVPEQPACVNTFTAYMPLVLTVVVCDEVLFDQKYKDPGLPASNVAVPPH